MAKIPLTIWKEAVQEWLANQKKNGLDCDRIPFKYLETKFRLEGYGKKRAFDWICELSELYDWDFDGAYVKIH